LGTIGDTVYRRDHEKFNDAIGVSSRKDGWLMWIAANDGEALVLHQQLSRGEMNLVPLSKPVSPLYARGVAQFWLLHDRVLLLQSREADVAAFTRQVIDGAAIAKQLPGQMRFKTIAPARWRTWIEQILEIQQIANALGWVVTPLSMAPPASAETIARLEKQAGLAVIIRRLHFFCGSKIFWRSLPNVAISIDSSACFCTRQRAFSYARVFLFG
jgi:hypothetical protein